MAEGEVMKSNWLTSLLVCAAVLLLIVDQRLELLALVAPLSIGVSLIAVAQQRRAEHASVECRQKQ
jgi:hypothetical protein